MVHSQTSNCHEITSDELIWPSNSHFWIRLAILDYDWFIVRATRLWQEWGLDLRPLEQKYAGYTTVPLFLKIRLILSWSHCCCSEWKSVIFSWLNLKSCDYYSTEFLAVWLWTSLKTTDRLSTSLRLALLSIKNTRSSTSNQNTLLDNLRYLFFGQREEKSDFDNI